MCTKIKLIDGQNYTPREIVRVTFGTIQFNGFCRKENIGTTWGNRILGYYSVPICGYTEKCPDGLPLDFEENGELVFVKVKSFKNINEEEIRIVTTKAQNGTLYGRKPFVLKQVSAKKTPVRSNSGC
jgi:hypothetical protein